MYKGNKDIQKVFQILPELSQNLNKKLEKLANKAQKPLTPL